MRGEVFDMVPEEWKYFFRQGKNRYPVDLAVSPKTPTFGRSRRQNEKQQEQTCPELLHVRN